MEKNITISVSAEDLQKICARNRSCNTLKFLLKQKLDPNTVIDDNGNTLLHYAACRGLYDAVELLIENGADINARNNDGNTPLNLAILNKQENIVEELLKNGANGHLQNKKGQYSLIIAQLLKQFKIQLLLLRYRENGRSKTPMKQSQTVQKDEQQTTKPTTSEEKPQTRKRKRILRPKNRSKTSKNTRPNNPQQERLQQLIKSNSEMDKPQQNQLEI